MRQLTSLTALAACCVSSLAFAKVVVFPVQGTNLDSAERQAIGALIAQSYQTESGEETISPRRASPALRETDDYGAAARQLQANEYVAIDAVGLHKHIIITATRYFADGRVIHTAKMTADGMDDMEVVSERLARALRNRTSVKQTRTLESVGRTEGQRRNRTWVEKIMGIKASGDYWLGYGVDLAPTLTVSFDGRLESERYFLEFGAGFVVSADAPDSEGVGGLTSEIGASFYLTQDNVAPYLGAGVLPRILTGGVNTTGANIAAYLQGGVMLMRESSSRVYFDVRAAQSLMPMRFGDDIYDPTGVQTPLRTKYPTEFSLNAGIGW